MIKFGYLATGEVSEEDFLTQIKIKKDLGEKLAEYEMTEWIDLPEKMLGELDAIELAAKEIRAKNECLVCLGIGGSYLGAKAILEALGGDGKTEIIFSGNSFSEVELRRALERVKGKDFAINVISKSGKTLETALAFNLFKEKLIEYYGEEVANEKIYATTSDGSGDLYEEAQEKGYKTFVIPDGAGGRYSVLSAVGLLPLAVAGIDVRALLEGAIQEKMELEKEQEALRYAVMRNVLFEAGYETEIFANFEPSFRYINEWIKQLFGESEGKENKGILPVAVEYSTDLHSLGQYMQEGRRNIFETFVEVPSRTKSLVAPEMAGKTMAEINEIALKATEAAHVDGGIPVLRLVMPSWDERGMGALIFFLEMSCALSAIGLGVNPFNQPGVENYKIKMKELLKLEK